MGERGRTGYGAPVGLAEGARAPGAYERVEWTYRTGESDRRATRITGPARRRIPAGVRESGAV
ncbi:hypothetical protein, partial [Streptomyces exfoliatus]|uniref:hypothetical protein n=1 Tax=Streptomyces exfoliatus TaxID=1905 RepID=UPI0019D71433